MTDEPGRDGPAADGTAGEPADRTTGDGPAADGAAAAEPGGDSGVPAGTVFCSWCGTHASTGAPPTWSMQTGPRGVELLCEACTRANLRAIEAKLGSDWW